VYGAENTILTGDDTFSYKATDGTVDSTAATVAISVNTGVSLTDSFEGTPPNGWDPAIWNQTTIPNRTQVATTSEAGTPPGGGTYALRQSWPTGSSGSQWLRQTIPSGVTAEGEVFEFEYYLKYDANFDTNNTYLKNIVMRANGINEFYLDIVPSGSVGVIFQQTNDTHWLYSNVNGSTYDMPMGEWVHFKWQIKVSTETNGDPRTGFLYGWVNGTKRFEYNNINTIYTGQYSELNLNTTFNDTLSGPNQNRYWDLFSIGPIAP